VYVSLLWTKFKGMNLEKLKDNEYFRDLLQQADEYSVQCAGMNNVP
jgi:hypothetical protein